MLKYAEAFGQHGFFPEVHDESPCKPFEPFLGDVGMAEAGLGLGQLDWRATTPGMNKGHHY